MLDNIIVWIKQLIAKSKEAIINNYRFAIKYILLSLLFASLFILYFIIDKLAPFYESTKKVGKFTINGVEFTFPSTTESLLTALVCNVLIQCIIQGIIIKLYYDHIFKEEAKLESIGHKIKKMAYVGFIACICEAVRNLLREFNTSFKVELGDSRIFVCLLLFILISLACTILSRIFGSIRVDAVNHFHPKLFADNIANSSVGNPGIDPVNLSTVMESKDPIEINDNLPEVNSHIYKKAFEITKGKVTSITQWIKTTSIVKSVRESLSKLGGKRALTAIFLCSLIGFIFVYLTQLIEVTKKWKLHLCTINGNSIDLLDNKDNILFIMFFEMLMLTIALKIVGYLDKQKKIKAEYEKYCAENNIDSKKPVGLCKRFDAFCIDINEAAYHTIENKSGMASAIFQTIAMILSANVFTAVRRNITHFKNPQDIGSWAVCFVFVLIAFIVSTYFLIKNVKSIGETAKRDEDKKTINPNLCFLCQREHLAFRGNMREG